MRVNFSIKYFLKEYWHSLTCVFLIASLVFGFFGSQAIKNIFGVVFLIVALIILVVMYYKAITLENKSLIINNTLVNIKFGDIFLHDGIKVITFNEFFDTVVDNKIISENSLCGIFINKYSKGSSAIDDLINNDPRLQKAIVEKNVKRLFGGKTNKYRLGSICPCNDFYLLAFTHFDQDNRAYLSLEDYFSCLMHMWYELDVLYSGKPINITLLGSGITRFNNIHIREQELLKYIILTFKLSMVNFKNTSLTIVLDSNMKDKVKLYDITEV